MGLWRHELRLFLRQLVALPALLLMVLLASAAVAAGLSEVARQNDAIARIQPQQAEDVAAIAKWVSIEGDAGNAAYYTFHATWDAPSPLAFAAIGQRDIAPYILRVRALGLEGQLYESENYNAELALPGRFDWAFVLTYLAPLFLIVLLHDLKSGEREAGRIGLLSAMARQESTLWRRRIALRLGLLFAAVALPFLIGAIISGTSAAHIGAVLLMTAAYLLFWMLVTMLIWRWQLSSVANAAALAASWLVLTLILPALAHVAINSAIPVGQGVELTLAQREAVHDGWDKPKEETMQAFFKAYPEWEKTKPIEGGFHWKWYYAFQHVGDISVADGVADYRQGLKARDSWTRRTGIALPAVGVQTLIHRLAQTDLSAQLAYQDRIRAFHARLRKFYYSYVFNDVPFRQADFAKSPSWNGNWNSPDRKH
jgi:ABC-2 type transport system permease protein